MTELAYKQYPSFPPQQGRPLKKVEISQNNIFITDNNNNVWQVWLSWDDPPQFQLLPRG